MSKKKYIEAHLLTTLEFFEEGIKYLNFVKDNLEIIQKINDAPNSKKLHKL